MIFKTKELKKLGIIPIKEIGNKQKNYISNFVAKNLTNKYSFIKLEYNEIYSTLINTPMYISNFTKKISKANYLYKNKSIYFSYDTNINIVDEFSLHEYIHRLQDKRGKKDKLRQLGNCEFTETKVKGLMFNEAAIQCIVTDILNRNEQIIDYNGLKIKTSSPNYYPIITSLMEEIINLVGNTQLVKSSLYGDNDFNYQVIDNFGEQAFAQIRDSFDKIIDYKKSPCDQENMINLYSFIQEKIYKQYFGLLNKRINQIEDIDYIKNKLENLKRFFNGTSIENKFEDFYKKELILIDDKEEKIKNKNSLILVKNNIFYKTMVHLKKIISRNNIKE